MTITPKTSKILTLSGLICLSVPVSLFLLWIHAFGLGTNPYERVDIFNSYLPTFLHDRIVNACFTLLLSFLSIVFCGISVLKSNVLFIIINMIIIILGSLFLLWNLFTMM